MIYATAQDSGPTWQKPLAAPAALGYRPPHTDAAPPRPFIWTSGEEAAVAWAVSSAVEHYVDIVVATGSIPVPPTIISPPPAKTGGISFSNAAATRRDDGENR